MNFAKLYEDNRDAVERALKAMWSGESGNESQIEYSHRLREVIREVFAPSDAVPVVQCMNSYEPVHSVTTEEAKSLVGSLWTKSYSPYEHQYQCWKALLEEKTSEGLPMSICVTTGTGSGKTECFMLPLVRDLIDNHQENQIQALFLYPLNALMEDQKERLEELLDGTDITYTVYNGDLPEDEPKPDDYSDSAERTRKRIRMIRGYDESTKTYKFRHMLYTRKMVRKTPPNILLTNPTMLEYILLRGTDANLTNPSLKSLRWIAIDETHTYTGAGAAELAMLLRRIILAFGVKASDIRFATSSATFGNGSDPQGEEKKLKEFIAGITGLYTDQVKVVDGKRVGLDTIPDGDDKAKWLKLFNKEYVSLNDLFVGKGTIEDKLKLLDEMCARVPNDASGNPCLKAKVHYFYRVPNNGLYVRLTEHNNGAFKIYTSNTLDEASKENPMLELSRCKHCGEYVALAQINNTPGEDFHRYSAIERDDSDMFDLLEDEDGETKYAIIGLAKGDNARGDNNISVIAQNGVLETETNLSQDLCRTAGWHLVANTHCRCPYCNVKLSHNKASDENENGDTVESFDNAYLLKFRTSADFISRFMAPSILNHVDKYQSGDPNKIILHDGQQYISFADSRQLAAKATLKQNLEQERDWFYSTIYHELCRRKNGEKVIDEEIAKISVQLPSVATDLAKLMELTNKIQELQGKKKSYLTWSEIASLLQKDKYCKVFCGQFVKRSGDSEELENDGSIPVKVIEKYIHSIMVMYLSTRPASAAAPETLGLFCTHYPQLNSITMLPEAVAHFNDILSDDKHKIYIEDWRNLIQIFMDYVVRSNQSLFLQLSDDNPLDIFACERFAIEKPKRRPVNKPILERGKLTQSRIVRYLCELIVMDKGNTSAKDVYNSHFDNINNVVEALWNDVTMDSHKLLEYSTHWEQDLKRFELDKDRVYRFNLKNLCFKLYDDVYLCDTNTDSSIHHIQCLRPIENHFKCFSPYLHGNAPVLLDEEFHEKWTTFPYYIGCGKTVVESDVIEWAKTNRKILWNHHLWGEDGCFENRLTNIHLSPNLFIQAEHTAQVDKDVSRTLQSEFKEHTINILACSTTMEMGVDLGNLEVVLLSSVPPQPSNYKQRAGRSGRNNKVKSVCITLCGSDAIGLRTLYNPIETIINRPVQVPMVDLMSPQVVQRHVNSYLVRAFGVFTEGDNGGKLTQKVFNYYSTFEARKNGTHIEVVDPLTNDEKSPNDKLGEKEGAMFERFNNMCLQTLSDDVRSGLIQLLKGTIFDGHPEYVVDKAREANERCYAELNTKLEDLKFAYRDATNDKFRTKLKMQYYEILLDRLLNYWATNRFTPNANMPVNVLTLDLNSSGRNSFFTPSTSSNPSYGLREAIAQYAPGNNIVVDGVAYVVRGIEFTNMYQGVNVFKTIYRNNDKCVIDDSSIDGKIYWSANEKDGLELVQPVGFIPDMNEDKTRIMDPNKYTHVSAQLIDTTDWSENVTEPHLFSVRSNRETGYAKILYYNEGLGYGYCMCSRCGRMTLESEVANPDDTLDKLPYDMNPRKSKIEDKPNYHFAITGKDYRKKCSGSNDKALIRRNVIIGDLVLTDFSEIRIRHKGQKKWLNNRSEDTLMFTLGIVFTQSLLDILGKERGAVDFAVMPNGHLCIFDTNPGGAGYANQMTSVPLMKEIITASKNMLLEAQRKNCKDLLLNKFTLRYIEKINIEDALAWIKEEEDARSVLPENVAAISKEATETSISSMLAAFNNSVQETIFFIVDKYKQWDYDGTEHGWRGHFFNSFHVHDKMTSLCIVEEMGHSMPEPILEMLRSAKNGWAKDIISIKNPYQHTSIFPIAYIDGILYFTNNVDFASLNDAWANSTLYCARIADITHHAKSVDCSYKDSTTVFILDDENTRSLRTDELGPILQSKSNGIIAQFIEYCKSNQDKKLVISYQDEHLKSILGIVLTLQTISYFVKQVSNDFSLEFFLEKYEGNENHSSITANLTSHMQRDLKLDDLTRGWLYELECEHVYGSLIPIQSREHNTLTHWRVLSMECAGKRLSIYPDGGFVNGWNILKDWTKNTKRFTLDNISANDVIYLKRCQSIKYDVTIEDIQE
jgi:hypothetical protein